MPEQSSGSPEKLATPRLRSPQKDAWTAIMEREQRYLDHPQKAKLIRACHSLSRRIEGEERERDPK